MSSKMSLPASLASRLNPTPYTLHLTPYTLHPTPYTLHPTPYTLHSYLSSAWPAYAHGAQPLHNATHTPRCNLQSPTSELYALIPIPNP